MKNKSILKALGIMILLTIVLTWVIPSASVGTDGIIIGKILPTGFADVFTCLEVVMQYFLAPSIFILFVGMFYGVINKTGAFKAVVDKIVYVSKEKKNIMLIATILFYVLITALTGMYLHTFMFIPLSIAVLMGLKFSKVQSILATAGASTIGLIGQISNKIIQSVTTAEGNQYLWVKVGLLVVLTLLASVYAIKMSKKKNVEEKVEDNNIMFVPTERNAINKSDVKGVGLFIVFFLLIEVFIFGLTPWNNVEMYNNLYGVIKDVKIGDFAPFSALLGSFEVFGLWTYNSLYPTIALAIIVMSLINSLKFKEMVEACIEGAKKVMGLAVLAAVITLVVIYTLNSGFLGTIINYLSRGGNIALITLSSFISAPFLVEMSYAAQYGLSLVYYAVGTESVSEIWGLVTQITYGLAMLAVPSSVLLMIVLGYVEEKYSKWIKYIWKLLLAIFIACLIAITVATLL